ncbi:MAG: hemerythrin domain-containing protein [Planctomycetota bacterium]|nr:hemerythrin domain-containing protein [Planctomycetota bacterium]
MLSDIAQQTLIEHQTLKHIVEALRTVLNWHVPEAGAPRKLTSLRFVTSSLQRHVEYMLNLEETGGYMPEIRAASPKLTDQVEALRQQHDEFRETLRQIVAGLEEVTAGNQQQFASLCERLTTLLAKLDEHSKKETELVQEAFLREEGGEG